MPYLMRSARFLRALPKNRITMSGAHCWSFSSTGGLASTWKQWWTTSQQPKWRLRVISRSMCCAKNEPTPRKVHLGGKMGIFALAGMISALCLTCEVSGGGKAVCIHGPVDCVVVQVCHLQCDCRHVQVTGMALNSAGFEVVGSSESDTEVALDLCSVHDSPQFSAANTASSPMFVTPEFATLSPESCPLIDTPVFSLSPESGPSYVASAVPTTPSQQGLTTDVLELVSSVGSSRGSRSRSPATTVSYEDHNPPTVAYEDHIPPGGR